MDPTDQWKNAKLPTRYNRAKKALAECATVDECAEWKNKAKALASYARQKNDNELLDRATEIKNRAMRRQKEILQGIEPKPGPGRGKKVGETPPTFSTPGRMEVAKAAGMTREDVKEAYRVGSIPEKEFEARVTDPNLGKPKPKPKASGPRYVQPSMFVDAIMVIADAKSARAVEPQEMAGLIPHVEKAIQNLTKFAIALKQRKPKR